MITLSDKDNVIMYPVDNTQFNHNTDIFGEFDIFFIIQQDDKCSRSRRRAAKADKRMVLVHTHGLFIT
jgi:hypothetical protein